MEYVLCEIAVDLVFAFGAETDVDTFEEFEEGCIVDGGLVTRLVLVQSCVGREYVYELRMD